MLKMYIYGRFLSRFLGLNKTKFWWYHWCSFPEHTAKHNRSKLAMECATDLLTRPWPPFSTNIVLPRIDIPFIRSQAMFIMAILRLIKVHLYTETVRWRFPDSKVHGANMRPTWVLSAPGGPHVSPINLVIRVTHAQGIILIMRNLCI